MSFIKRFFVYRSSRRAPPFFGRSTPLKCLHNYDTKIYPAQLSLNSPDTRAGTSVIPPVDSSALFVAIYRKSAEIFPVFVYNNFDRDSYQRRTKRNPVKSRSGPATVTGTKPQGATRCEIRGRRGSRMNGSQETGSALIAEKPARAGAQRLRVSHVPRGGAPQYVTILWRLIFAGERRFSC